ncbi:GntR family transcriptional regulator, partial [Elioraea sp. Yellowstone]|uniref:GntR family transcriptional regulator n=1 Tax=Elioraea sp. Yellowstone TaxID=2592070 RepID=UPI001F009C5C
MLGQIAELARAQGWGTGTHLTELGLARRLSVSRTPVRAALAHLAARGLLPPRPAGLLGVPGGRLAEGAAADLCLFDPDRAWQIRAD